MADVESYEEQPVAPMSEKRGATPPPPDAPRPDGGGAPGDDDVAYATLIMEQERAFFMARRGQLAELDLPDGRAASRARQPPRLTRRASPPRLALRSAQWAVDAGGGGEDEPLTEDEALARQLQADEAADWRARMLALAGLQPGGDAGEGAYDDEAEAEADEVDVDAMSYEQLLDLGAAAGAVSRGVADGFVLRLPRRRVTTEELSANDLCAVCRQEYVAEEELSELRCGHAFHGACLAPWLRAEKHCPSCRHDVVSPALAAKPAPNS